MRTVYPFTLPRGYLGPDGTLHRDGEMRLATGRDELEPLRDPFVKGPDDPRLTMLVLARVVQRLGGIEHVTINEIESMFAADLAFLQDFYSVVNFGDQAEYETLLRSAGRLRPELVVPGPGGPAGSVVEASAVVSIPEPTAPASPAPSLMASAGIGIGAAAAVPTDPVGSGDPDGSPLTGPSGQKDEFETRSGRVLTPPTRRDAILEMAAVGGRT